MWRGEERSSFLFFEDLLCLIIKGHNHLSDIYGMAGSAPGVFSMCSLITFTTSLQGCRLILLNGWKKEWRKWRFQGLNPLSPRQELMPAHAQMGVWIFITAYSEWPKGHPSARQLLNDQLHMVYAYNGIFYYISHSVVSNYLRPWRL